MLNDYWFLGHQICYCFVFQKLIIITEIALGDDDQFARRYA